MRSEHHRQFDLFGSTVAVHLGDPPDGPGRPSTGFAALEAEASLRRIHAQLTRFDPDSELSRLNRDSSNCVEVSPMVAELLAAVVEVGELTGGLVDATHVRALERWGYASSRVGLARVDLAKALGAIPTRAAAKPAASADWAKIEVDRTAGRVRRPPGVQIDSGGIAKGLAADLLARRFAGFTTYAIDCGGDLRIGGRLGSARRVTIRHPLRPTEDAAEFDLAEGAVATSGLLTRIWRHGEGYAHHLIDPSTQKPAWTGVIQATAIAPTGVEAEARAKAAVLTGPDQGSSWLDRFGGFLVTDDGAVKSIAGRFVGRADVEARKRVA